MKWLCAGNGQLHQMGMSEISNTLDCMHDQQILVGGRTQDEISASRNTILQALWETYGTEAVQQWGEGMLELVQQASVLQPRMPEGIIQEQTKDRDELEFYAQICKSKEGRRLLRNLRESGKNRRSSHRQQSTEQQSGKPSEIVQELSQFSSQEEGNLLNMWLACEGIELLQQALHSFQKIRRSNGNDASERTGGTYMEANQQRKYVLRRLTPLETLRLQGLPDWWVDGADGSDSAIYKMAGNGLAIPCAADVLGRIAEELRKDA